MFDRKLRIELVPAQAWKRNARSVLTQKTWHKISCNVRALHNHKCQICGAPAGHAHEVWEWIVAEGRLHQRLVDIESVCVNCHDVKHIGRIVATLNRKVIEDVSKHACKVNDMTQEALYFYVSDCIATHNIISKLPLGDLDLSWLEEPSTRLTLYITDEDLAPLHEGKNDEYHKESRAGEPA